MLLFLLFFLAAYGWMNFHVIRRLYLLHPGRKGYLWALIAIGGLLGAAPIFTRIFDHHSQSWAGRALLGAGNVWLALVFWLFCVQLAFDAWALAMKLLARTAPAARRLVPAQRAATLASMAIVAVVALYGLYEADHIRLKEIHLTTSRLSPGDTPIRILQISDTHLSPISGKRILRKVVDLTQRASPDMIVLTGDAVDMSFTESESLASLLAALAPPLGKYAVTGNHEYYTGLHESLAFLDAAGFVTLRDESMSAGERLIVAGVDDAHVMGVNGRATEDLALPAVNDGKFVLLLKHRPIVDAGAVGRFDLQLSGHVHGGQIFPFSIFVRMVHRYGPGLHELGGGSRLYVSRGAGTWGPPMRFLAPPDVTLIVLEPG